MDTTPQKTVADHIAEEVAKVPEKGTINEATAVDAMRLVGNLMLQNDLSLDDRHLVTRPMVEREIRTWELRTSPLDLLVPAVMEFCDVKAWTETRTTDDGKVKYVVFYGPEPDVAIAEHLLLYMRDAVGTEYHTYKQSQEYMDLGRKEKSDSSRTYRSDVAFRLNGRLAELKEELRGDIPKERHNLFEAKSSATLVALEQLDLKARNATVLEVAEATA